ncbi:Alpha/Beta hydrolase protein [Pseudomassariella vexata]|uniref:Alpha/Beta hydrolase protein n=1 Tax=Pseudomassariella vexata TaxID=1141098 RepID=A0A1Y2EFG5_9PEZI|nr:Alpha/Beta hydrolase protein [Pseudomassariella vexata]ORY70323.1 Alpha/Beta hydrolase protein [Pseudomassariella vexata]
MAPRTSQWAIPLGAGLGVPIALYTLFLFLGAFPFFQRQFLYAHKFNTLFWHDPNKPEYWGFARNQVTPFSLTTVDGETLYAWHVLPLSAYLRNEEKLQAQPAGFSNDFTKTESFHILRNDPNARLIISFHGNAGHIAQAIRPDHFHALTDTSAYHVLSIDYRGFGKSTGSPTEAGLIEDGATAVDWAMNVAKVPPSRIVIVGQSLGTAVTSAVAEHFAKQGIEFAGIILISGFSNLPTLLSRYMAAGFIPVLSPLRPFPPLLRFFQSFIVDKWRSADRLAQVVGLTRTRLRLTLIHAKNDLEIPCTESDALFRSAAVPISGTALDDDAFTAWKHDRTIVRDDGTFIVVAKAEPDIVIREELVPYGGHNDVTWSSPVALAVMRSFDSDSTEAS